MSGRVVLETLCQEFVESVMFSGVPNVPAKLDALGLEYCKGKTIDDLRKALKRGREQGLGKTEFEIGMMTATVKAVLKCRKASKAT